MGNISTFTTNTGSREPGTVSNSEQVEIAHSRSDIIQDALRELGVPFANVVTPNLNEVAREASQNPNLRANLQREIAELATNTSPLYDAVKAEIDSEPVQASTEDLMAQMADNARRIAEEARVAGTEF